MTDEAVLVDEIRRAFGGMVAPGAYDFVDDAAMIPPVLGDRARVITTDVVVESVDFDRALYPIAYAGFRALAQNLSDVAAMGASPTGFVWSLAIPPSWSVDDVAEFARGAAILAKLRRVPIYGGDLSATSGPLVCSITAFGDVAGLPLRRSGVRPGDALYLASASGGTVPTLGASAAGLRMVRAHPMRDRAKFDAWLRALPENDAACVRAHVSPLPVDGAQLVGVATACMDLSDGLGKDAARLARASNVRLDLDGAALTSCFAPGATRDEALFGGEDYALLFAAPPSAKAAALGTRIGVAVEVHDGPGVFLDGTALPARGFDHFAGRS